MKSGVKQGVYCFGDVRSLASELEGLVAASGGTEVRDLEGQTPIRKVRLECWQPRVVPVPLSEEFLVGAGLRGCFRVLFFFTSFGIQAFCVAQGHRLAPPAGTRGVGIFRLSVLVTTGSIVL